MQRPTALGGAQPGYGGFKFTNSAAQEWRTSDDGDEEAWRSQFCARQSGFETEIISEHQTAITPRL